VGTTLSNRAVAGDNAGAGSGRFAIGWGQAAAAMGADVVRGRFAEMLLAPLDRASEVEARLKRTMINHQGDCRRAGRDVLCRL